MPIEPSALTRWRAARAAGSLAVPALACLALGTSPAPAWRAAAPPAVRAMAPISPAAVFGTDHRVPLPAQFKDVQDKIGLLFHVRARMVCTAFCVAKDIIATAGHCLYRTLGERPPQLDEFWFGRNYDTVRDFARIAGHDNASV